MKSWITACARPAKCGGFGSSGDGGTAARAAAGSDSASRPASAILPTPMPQSWKKWRRVMSRRLMVSPFHDRFIEVHDGPGDERPGGPLGRVGVVATGKLFRGDFAGGQSLPLPVEVGGQRSTFIGVEFP